VKDASARRAMRNETRYGYSSISIFLMPTSFLQLATPPTISFAGLQPRRVLRLSAEPGFAAIPPLSASAEISAAFVRRLFQPFTPHRAALSCALRGYSRFCRRRHIFGQ